MKKKYLIITISLLILLSIIVIYRNLRIPNGLNITINNKTKVNIENMYLSYNGSKDIKIPNIRANDKYKINIKNTQFNQGQLTLYYYDKHKLKIEEVLIGYFEENDTFIVDVNVLAITEDKHLKLQVHSNQKYLNVK